MSKHLFGIARSWARHTSCFRMIALIHFHGVQAPVCRLEVRSLIPRFTLTLVDSLFVSRSVRQRHAAAGLFSSSRQVSPLFSMANMIRER